MERDRSKNIETEEDERLARDAKSGCRRSRNALFMRHTRLVRRLAIPAGRLLLSTVRYRRLTNPAIELADVDQQAFLVFCTVLDEWDPTSEPFLVCLTRRMPGHLLHYVRHSLRYARRERSLTCDGESEEPLADECEGDPANKQESGEDEVVVSELPSYARALPRELQVAVRMRYFAGYSSSRIARITHRDRRTVNRDLQTALALLRDSILEELEGA